MAFDHNSKEQWIFLWGNQVYSSRRYYKMVFQNLHSHLIFKKISKSKCTPRLKFFAWLLAVDRLNTRSMLLRRHFNVQPNSYCVFCASNSVEDLDHLFFSCPFASACWRKLGFRWPCIVDINDRVLNLQNVLGLPYFMEIFIIAAWKSGNLGILRSLTMVLQRSVFGLETLRTRFCSN